MRTKTFLLGLISVALIAEVGYAQEIATESENMVIGASWGDFYSLIAEAAEEGIKIAMPEGFAKQEESVSESANYGYLLYSGDEEAVLQYSHIIAPSNLSVSEFEGETIVARVWGKEKIEPSKQNPDATEILYQQILSNKVESKYTENAIQARTKELPAKQVVKMFNADKALISRNRTDSLTEQKYCHRTNLVIKRDDKLISISLLMTDKGKKSEKRYLKAIMETIRFE